MNASEGSQSPRFLAIAGRMASIVLVCLALICFLALFYFLYQYTLTGSRVFYNVWFMALYYGVPAVSGTLLLGCLKLNANHRINLALFLCTSLVSIYALETVLALWSGLPSVLDKQSLKVRSDRAKAYNVEFDTRSKREIINALVADGIDAVPSISVKDILSARKKSEVEAIFSLKGVSFLPLAGISRKTVVLCNESGEYVTYKADEHGFNNPAGLWESERINIVVVGDSFVQGYCVPAEKHFVGFLRERHPGILNLGIEGNGPLAELAALKEYGQVFKPRIVLWAYFEANDLLDLELEAQSAILKRYFEPKYRQNLVSQQDEIDRAILEFIEVNWAKGGFAALAEELFEKLSDKDELLAMIPKVTKLHYVRDRLGLLRNRGENQVFEVNPARREKISRLMELFRLTLKEANELVSSWGGRLYFVYLPGWDRYDEATESNPDRDLVLKVVKDVGLVIVDMHPAFQAEKDPVSLFPFGLPGHYTVEGNRVIAEKLEEVISSR